MLNGVEELIAHYSSNLDGLPCLLGRACETLDPPARSTLGTLVKDTYELPVNPSFVRDIAIETGDLSSIKIKVRSFPAALSVR